jgi:hypothetical protein
MDGKGDDFRDERSKINKKNVPTPPRHSKLRTKHTIRKYCIVFWKWLTVDGIRLTEATD